MISSSIIQHWDGNAWSNVKFPHPNRPGVMAGVGASGPNDVWAVGRNYSGDLTLTHDGRGLLMVTGNLTLSGPRIWDGVMLVGSPSNDSGRGAAYVGKLP